MNILLNKANILINKESLNLPSRLNSLDDSDQKILKKYEYPICSWPVLINSNTSKEFNELAIIIPKLINQLSPSIGNTSNKYSKPQQPFENRKFVICNLAKPMNCSFTTEVL